MTVTYEHFPNGNILAKIGNISKVYLFARIKKLSYWAAEQEHEEYVVDFTLAGKHMGPALSEYQLKESSLSNAIVKMIIVSEKIFQERNLSDVRIPVTFLASANGIDAFRAFGNSIDFPEEEINKITARFNIRRSVVEYKATLSDMPTDVTDSMFEAIFDTLTHSITIQFLEDD